MNLLKIVATTIFLTSYITHAAETSSLNIQHIKDVLPIGSYTTIFVDQSGGLSIDQVRDLDYKEKFKQSDEIPRLGFTSFPIWSRLELFNPTGENAQFYIESKYNLLDFITLYPPPNLNQKPQKAGDHVGMEERGVKNRQHVFHLSVPPGRSVWFIRTQSEGSINLPYFIDRVEGFEEVSRIGYVLVGLVCGFLLVMFFYNLIHAVSFKSTAYYSYCAYLLFFLFFEIGLQGLAHEIFSPSLAQFISNDGLLYSIQGVNIFATLFAFAFFKINEQSNFSKWFFVSLIVGGSLIGLLVTFLPYSPSARIVNVYSGILSVSLLTYGIIQAIKGYRPAIFYCLGWTALLVGNISLVLSVAGIIPVNNFVNWGAAFGGCLEFVLFSFALTDRINVMRNEQAEKIKNLNDSLEDQVRERTRDIKVILDNVKSGFFLVDRELVIKKGFTESCSTIMGKGFKEGENLGKFLKLDDKNLTGLMLAVDQIFDDLMPEKASLANLPKQIVADGRVISIEGSVVRKNNIVHEILFTVNDISNAFEVEQENHLNRTLLSIMRHRDSFLDFLYETKECFNSMGEMCARSQFDSVLLELHTLKGNFYSFGLFQLARRVHELENTPIEWYKIEELRIELMDFLESHFDVLKVDFSKIDDRVYGVSESDFELFQHKVPKQKYAEIRRFFDSWKASITRKSAKSLLGPIRESTDRICAALGKKVSLHIEGGDTLINPNQYNGVFRNVIHLIRNSIDHGIEEVEDRGEKPETGEISISFQERNGVLVIEVKDDGMGLNISEIKRKAIEVGVKTEEELNAMDQGEIYNIIFDARLSTSEQVSEISGRGVGMTALYKSVLDNEGQIAIKSEQGKGMTCTIELPLESRQVIEKSSSIGA